MARKWMIGLTTAVFLLIFAQIALAEAGSIPVCPICKTNDTVRKEAITFSDCKWKCNQCNNRFVVTHTQLCPYICEYCGLNIYGLGHDFVDAPFVSNGDGTHSQTCRRAGCTAKDVGIRCSGGAASCAAKAVCAICNEEYGELEAHGPSYIVIPLHNGTHAWKCTTCQGNVMIEACGGGTATCAAKAECASCGAEYGDYAHAHDFSAWRSNGDGTHTKKCVNCDTVTGNGIACSGGTATCAGAPVCQYCLTPYGGGLGHDYSGPAATCTLDQLCARANCGAVVQSALGHDEVEHDARNAACCEIGWEAYVTCGREGCTYTTYREIPELGHQYKAYVQKPTCVKKGYTVYKCALCGEKYRTNEKKALSHQLTQWSPNGDGTHRSVCARNGCEYQVTVACARTPVTRDGATWMVCPVCGAFGNVHLDGLENALVTPADAAANRGEWAMYGGKAPFDGALYVITLACETEGVAQAIHGVVSASIPLELTRAFKLVRVDAEEDLETKELAEVWTELPFVYDNGVLCFETDAGGVFMLMPIE